MFKSFWRWGGQYWFEPVPVPTSSGSIGSVFNWVLTFPAKNYGLLESVDEAKNYGLPESWLSWAGQIGPKNGYLVPDINWVKS